ncbi:hypothetical protein DY000_02002862 [Brassica cretica]|uniref:CPBP family intramembrane metalloprotease n=1 Tax=Brassica cretica TaxID=69181 RepID=A0ABQ7BX40_BRACR|nr:hypothetical protein DY000_02002862 [Brassica cretica]
MLLWFCEPVVVLEFGGGIVIWKEGEIWVPLLLHVFANLASSLLVWSRFGVSSLGCEFAVEQSTIFFSVWGEWLRTVQWSRSSVSSLART